MPERMNCKRTKSLILFDDRYTSATTEFFRVAIHEIGHTLGLDHCPATDQIMTAFISNFGVFGAPQYGDIAGMEGKWGVSGTQATAADRDEDSTITVREGDTETHRARLTEPPSGSAAMNSFRDRCGYLSVPVVAHLHPEQLAMSTNRGRSLV